MAESLIVGDEEIYGRFVMRPRHYVGAAIGERFLSLRPIDRGGISGVIVSRFREGETLLLAKERLEKIARKQSVTALCTASAGALRSCSIPGKMKVDVVLTDTAFPYHAEIRCYENDEKIIMEELTSAEFMFVRRRLQGVLMKSMKEF